MLPASPPPDYVIFAISRYAITRCLLIFMPTLFHMLYADVSYYTYAALFCHAAISMMLPAFSLTADTDYFADCYLTK